MTTNPFSVTIGAPSQLEITSSPPSSITAGAPFGLTVAVTDAYGNVESSYSGQVTIGLLSDPANGVLNGTHIASVTNGVVAFAGLTLDTAATGYTIQARAGSLNAVTSNPIAVTPAAPAALQVFIAPPTSMVAGAHFGLGILAEDQYGNIATNFAGNIAIALASNPQGATLLGGGGSLVLAATNGVANFNPSLTIEKAGSGYEIVATSSGLTSVTTAAITVTPAAASQLVVQAEPASSLNSGGNVGLTVAAKDQYGNLATGFNGPVAVALPAGSTVALGGSTTVTASAGVATFQGLTLSGPTATVSLQVSSSGLTGTSTTPITVTAAQTGGGSTGGGGNNGSSGSGNGNGGGNTTPPVTMQAVQVVKNKRRRLEEIVLSFSGALNAAEADNVGEYSLIVAGKHNSFTAKNAKHIGLASASYNAATHTVTLVPSKHIVIKKPVELIVNGTAPSGLEDSSSRLIDGNKDGQPGGNAVAVFTAKGATISAVAGGAAAVDQLVLLGALPTASKARKS